MKAIILAAVAALALVGTAQAELTGTHLDMTVIHTGHAGVVRLVTRHRKPSAGCRR